MSEIGDLAVKLGVEKNEKGVYPVGALLLAIYADVERLHSTVKRVTAQLSNTKPTKKKAKK